MHATCYCADVADDKSGVDPIAAWRAMLMAHSRALRAIQADLDVAGVVPLTWYDVLLELKTEEAGLRMQDLGERVVLSRTRVSRLVDELERAGLVLRKPDKQDGRAVLALITPQGRQALRAAAPHYLRGIERHFTRHLTEAEQRAITSGLTRVITSHDSQI